MYALKKVPKTKRCHTAQKPSIVFAHSFVVLVTITDHFIKFISAGVDIRLIKELYKEEIGAFVGPGGGGKKSKTKGRPESSGERYRYDIQFGPKSAQATTNRI